MERATVHQFSGKSRSRQESFRRGASSRSRAGLLKIGYSSHGYLSHLGGREYAMTDDVSAPHDIHCLISEQQLTQRVEELARQISADYAGKRPLLVGVLKGAWVFMADLVRRLTIPVRCDFVKLSSYGDDTSTSGCV